MNRAINILLYEKVVDGLDILVFASVSGTQDGTDANGILVHELDCLLRVYNVAVLGAVDILISMTRRQLSLRDLLDVWKHTYLFLNVKVSRCLLPTDLNGTVHDDIGLVKWLASLLALILPDLLHGEDAEHDGFGTPDGAGSHGVAIGMMGRDVEETGQHGNTAVLNVYRFERLVARMAGKHDLKRLHLTAGDWIFL
jgi:hypothetical protein